MTSLLKTNPATEEQGSDETIPWALDISPQTALGETPSLLGVTLTDAGTGQAYSAGLVSPGVLNGSTVFQIVGGLRKGHVYDLEFRVQFAPGKVLAPTLRITCPR